jgi:L-lysine 2,3-aminomutase
MFYIVLALILSVVTRLTCTRARELCETSIYAADTASEEEKSIHQPTTHTYRNAVILVPVVKACIPTYIERVRLDKR